MSISTALKARREQLRDREAGFTLIELLVVVIIIGILAAIAIPVYIGVQNSAKDSAVKSDLASARIAANAWYTDKGTWPTVSSSDAAGNRTSFLNYGWTGSSVTDATKTAPASSTNFCFKAKSDSNTWFYITATQAAGAIDATACTAGV